MPDSIDPARPAVPAGLTAALADRYRLERELGQGGMATVYLAEDLKHRRKVAVKVLRAELAATLGPERFAREIEVAARLQHPNILALHDSGEADGYFYYVMPYVDGETLRQRLARSGELPVSEALRLLGDVAEALAAAHRQGVVHRDIKPENIMLTGRRALVMDFGISKAVNEATGYHSLTTAGVALGTPAYMAPEQAMAEPQLDQRVDIYALGVVAYEMLTGRTPFQGVTAQQALVAHVAQEPVPVGERRQGLSEACQALVMKCLAKRPADRHQTADELLSTLEPLMASSGAITPAGSPSAGRGRPRRRLLLMTLGAAALLVPGVQLGWRLLRPPLQLTTTDALQVTSEPGPEWMQALSPDGSQVAFVAVRHGREMVVVRSTAGIAGGGELLPAPGISGQQRFPAWSHDGERIRFLSCQADSCEWREVGRLGGAVSPVPLPLHTSTEAWSRDGAHVAFVTGDSFFVHTVADQSTRLLMVHDDPWTQHSLVWSPDGQRIAYVNGNPLWRNSTNTAGCSIWVVEVGSGQRVAVTDDHDLNVSPVWLDSRHLLFVSDRDGPREVFAAAVGPSGGRGEPRKVPGGTDAHSIVLSADGRRLAVSRLQIRQNIREYPVTPSGAISIREGREITHGTQVVEELDVSSDGRWLAFDSNRRGNADIYRLDLGGGGPFPVVTTPNEEFAPRLSPDGTEIAYYATPGNDVYVVPAEGGAPARLTEAQGYDNFPSWSADGLGIAFQSDRTGRYEVWMATREDAGRPWREAVQLTDFGCYLPQWLAVGRGVVCRHMNGRELIAVGLSGETFWRRDVAALGFARFSAWTLEDGGSVLYLSGTRQGLAGIWSWRLPDEAPRLLVAFDDPLFRPYVLASRTVVHGNRIYLTVGQLESDLWVMDLRR